MSEGSSRGSMTTIRLLSNLKWRSIRVRVPRTGGVILAIGERAAIEAYVAADPFTLHGVAE
ncbi:hypothetical protein ACC724_38700 [Rhizobium ruizarguesonis]